MRVVGDEESPPNTDEFFVGTATLRVVSVRKNYAVVGGTAARVPNLVVRFSAIGDAEMAASLGENPKLIESTNEVMTLSEWLNRTPRVYDCVTIEGVLALWLVTNKCVWAVVRAVLGRGHGRVVFRPTCIQALGLVGAKPLETGPPELLAPYSLCEALGRLAIETTADVVPDDFWTQTLERIVRPAPGVDISVFAYTKDLRARDAFAVPSATWVRDKSVLGCVVGAASLRESWRLLGPSLEGLSHVSEESARSAFSLAKELGDWSQVCERVVDRWRGRRLLVGWKLALRTEWLRRFARESRVSAFRKMTAGSFPRPIKRRLDVSEDEMRKGKMLKQSSKLV